MYREVFESNITIFWIFLSIYVWLENVVKGKKNQDAKWTYNLSKTDQNMWYSKIVCILFLTTKGIHVVLA